MTVINLLKLTRIHKPIGIFLLLIPSFSGLIIANNHHQNNISLKICIIFFIGAIIMRSVGCIINDLVDIKFDRQTSRTKDRPLANQSVTIKQSLILIAFLLFIGLLLLLQLNWQTIIYAILIIMPLIIIYPFAKRFTFYPQILLAIVFNSPFLLALTANDIKINQIHLLCYLSLTIWTIIYDTIYGFQDLKDDLKSGVKSLAIKINKKAKIILLLLNLVQWVIMLIVPLVILTDSQKNYQISFFYFFTILLAILLSNSIIKNIVFEKQKSCYQAFIKQQIIGILYLIIFLNLTI